MIPTTHPSARTGEAQARSCARHARYPARPPLAATSRLTVEDARPRRDAMALNVSPRCTPRLISSRWLPPGHPTLGPNDY